MKRVLASLLLSGVVSFGFVGMAAAGEEGERSHERGREEHRDGRGRDREGRRGVPEFDPATAGAVAVMIAGGGLILLRRRKR